MKCVESNRSLIRYCYNFMDDSSGNLVGNVWRHCRSRIMYYHSYTFWLSYTSFGLRHTLYTPRILFNCCILFTPVYLVSFFFLTLVSLSNTHCHISLILNLLCIPLVFFRCLYLLISGSNSSVTAMYILVTYLCRYYYILFYCLCNTRTSYI